jgi:hypothetical protein
MDQVSPALQTSLGALAAEWAGAVVGFAEPMDVATAAATMTDDGVLRNASALVQVQRAIDAYRIAIAGEFAARSEPTRGLEGMARRAGHSRPAHHLAEV